MIRVQGRANSVNVQKVMWCAAELKLEIDRSDIGGAFGGNDSDTYLANNPNGKIPTLIEEDFVLWESNAIVRYLCEQHGSAPWHPENSKKRGLANQWMDWYLTTLHPYMTTIFWQLIRTPDNERDHLAVQSATKEANQLWEILDQHLSDKPYILGKNPSMADIPVGCAAYRWFNMEVERSELRNLARWQNSLAEREAYQHHVMLPLT